MAQECQCHRCVCQWDFVRIALWGGKRRFQIISCFRVLAGLRLYAWLVGWLREALLTEKRDDFFFFSESSCLLSRLWGVRASIIGSYCVGGSPGIMYGNRRRMKTGGVGEEAREGGVAGPER